MRTALALAVVLMSMPSAAQEVEGLAGTWLIRRAASDELVLRLGLDGDGATVEVIGALGRWGGLPNEAADRGAPVALSVVHRDEDTAWLALAEWNARLVRVHDGLALWLPDGADEIGLAYRPGPVPTPLLGDWERAELQATGPRLRRLRVGVDEAITWDSRGRPTTLVARGLAALDGETAVSLVPEGRSGVAVRLVPVGAAWLGLECGGDELSLVFAPGATPTWLEASRPPPSSGTGGGVIGRWLVGRGDGSRLTALLSSTVSGVTWTHLGRGEEEPATLVLGTASEPGWLTIGDGAPRRLWLPGVGDGLLWPSDDDQYSTLWAVGVVPAALLGEWSVEGPSGQRAVRIGSETWAADREALPIVGLSSRDGAWSVAVLEDDRAGRRLRWWPVDVDELVAEDGARWLRRSSTP